MSASFEISSSASTYQVTIATGLFSETISQHIGQQNDAQILADAFFATRLAGHAQNPILIEASETEKSLDRAPALIERMRALGMKRQSLLLAIGGGIIQDISAFAASVYMRGLTWVYVPTTVLAMVDSCIGGKSSINVGPYKNLIGTYHPPQHIYIDPALVETLPRDQFASGLIEAAKICFCHGTDSFARHLSYSPSLSMPVESFEKVVVNSLLAKKHFIEIDEFDKKERLLLNFGHTFGHALEGASHFGIPHGIAVGLGIQCSLAFQRQRDINFQQCDEVRQLEQHLDLMIRTLPDLKQQLTALNVSEVFDCFASDKKHTRDHWTLLLVSEQGEVRLEKLPRTDALNHSIERAIQTTIRNYTN
jgi:3-dehydroquinate synthase